MHSKLLKAINYLSITITVVLTIIFFVNLFGNSLYRNDPGFLRLTPNLITLLILVFLTLTILIKGNRQKGNMMFALFLSLISDDWLLQYFQIMNPDWVPDALVLTVSIITGTVYIKAFQCFPRQITEEDIKSVFPKSKILSGYITLAIKNNTWIIFPIVLGGISIIGSPSLMDVFIMITALLGLYVNYKKSSSNGRDKILWLFWGLLTFTFLVIVQMLLNYYTKESSNTIRILFSIFRNSVLVCSLLMSLFFSNAFDTGILIRRTLVDGFIFVLIVIIYNTLEHYLLHWLSHKLEISDALLSSLLSGIFVLAFSPLHHKFMSFLERKVKKHPHGHIENTNTLESTNDKQTSP